MLKSPSEEPPRIWGDILVVDDILANLRLLIDLLSAKGYTVRPAHSGQLALAAVESKPPDLILLDIHMPEMNGFEVCSKLKANETMRDIPIIFISAFNDTASKLEAFTKGAVDYIAKPFQLEEVLVRIETHLTIRRLRLRLEERNYELAAFDRSVAHDLRSPLTAVIGMSQLMEMNPSERSSENISVVLSAAMRMKSIIDSLLLFAKIGNAKAETQSLQMEKIVSDVVRDLSLVINERRATVRVAQQDWPVVEGYAPWVAQVWENYLNNALKYGGSPPEISIGCDDCDDCDNSFIRFWVRDNGVGLTAHESDTVFQEFSRFGSPEKEEGHGLGLSIVSRIIRKLGGEVGVESTPGLGSCFYFTLKRGR